MKVIYLICFISISFLSPLSAQVNLELGGGSTYSKPTFPSEIKNNAIDFQHNGLNNFYLFVGAGTGLFTKAEAFLELQYAQNGYTIQSGQGVNTSEFGRKTNYIQVVPKLSYEAFNHLKLQAGPYFAFNVSETFKLTNQDWQDYQELESKSIDAGVVFNLKLCITRFSFNAGMQIGLKDVDNIKFTDANGNDLGSTNSKNRLFHIGVGYRII